jgi:hypothetical protein
MNINAINMVDLEDVIRSKNRNGPGLDGINMELLMYASDKMKKQDLTMYGM